MKTGKKVEIELFRYGTVLFGRFLDMDNRLRDSGTLWESAPDGFEICSFVFPELGDSVLNLPGADTDEDDNIFYWSYDSEERAIVASKRIKEGLRHINEAAKEEDDQPESDGEVIRVL